MDGKVKCLSIVKARTGDILLEEAAGELSDEQGADVRNFMKELKDLDSKRKDKGRFDKSTGTIHYTIDMESIAYIILTDFSYPDTGANDLLVDVMKGLEARVEEYEEASAETIKAKFSKQAVALLKAYADPANLPKVGSTTASIGDKIAMGMKKMGENIENAMKNTQDLQQTQAKSHNAKLIAQELDYESDDLQSSMSWRNNNIPHFVWFLI